MTFPQYDERTPYQDPYLGMFIYRHWKPYYPRPIGNLWHYHKQLELLCILEGRMEMRIEEEKHRLEQGDVLLIGSSQPHCTWSVDTERVVYTILHFEPVPYLDPAMLVYYRFFAEIDAPLSRINRRFKESPELREQVGRMMLQLLAEVEQKPIGYEISASLTIKQLLLLTLRHGSPKDLGELSTHTYNLRPVLEYVDRNLTEKIDMEPVSAMMGMSYHYFSRYFKSVIGMTFVEYVHMRRIKEAERLLLTESCSIANVAARVGITNMTYFYKLFKRFHQCSPKEYVQRVQAGRTAIPSSGENAPELEGGQA
jgi:AraC-like DNA-binding protein